jgi:hypothetical protein
MRLTFPRMLCLVLSSLRTDGRRGGSKQPAAAHMHAGSMERPENAAAHAHIAHLTNMHCCTHACRINSAPCTRSNARTQAHLTNTHTHAFTHARTHIHTRAHLQQCIAHLLGCQHHCYACAGPQGGGTCICAGGLVTCLCVFVCARVLCKRVLCELCVCMCMFENVCECMQGGKEKGKAMCDSLQYTTSC